MLVSILTSLHGKQGRNGPPACLPACTALHCTATEIVLTEYSCTATEDSIICRQAKRGERETQRHGLNDTHPTVCSTAVPVAAVVHTILLYDRFGKYRWERGRRWRERKIQWR